MSIRKGFLLATMLLAGAATRAADPAVTLDWPQFGGANAKTAVDGRLARTWPETGPREVWQCKLGAGLGGAAVRGGKVYILDRAEGKTDVLRCLDAATGAEAWSVSYDAPGNVSYPGPRSTPAVDDRVVVTVGCFGQVQAVDVATHQRLWMHNLLEEFPESSAPNWGVSHSALLYHDLAIAAPQNKDASLVAFDRLTGKVVWKADGLGGSRQTSYASPRVVNVNGADQIVMLTQKDGKKRTNIFGVDPADGKVLWNFTGWGCGIPIPQPVYCGDGRFFISAGYNANSAMFRVEKQGDRYVATNQIFNAAAEFNGNPPAGKGAPTEEALAKPGAACSSHLHTPVFYRDCLFANGNSKQNGNATGLICLGLDGLPKWKTGRTPAVDMGDVIVVDDLLVSLAGDGTLRLAEASPAGYKQLAEVRVLAQKNTVWAPLAFADGKLYVRDNTSLKCLDLRAAKP
jgi:outer membrane protein assembly factor BamB